MFLNKIILEQIRSILCLFSTVCNQFFGIRLTFILKILHLPPIKHEIVGVDKIFKPCFNPLPLGVNKKYRNGAKYKTLAESDAFIRFHTLAITCFVFLKFWHTCL